ncbi:hypothetical protein ACFPDQ_06000 [Pseudofrancisella aestuarii]|uniref:Thaumarchaeal output domain-containing protein n=1 Tax=Pseudofrancisella aestuarii TaxID=2670347 RepID=A0ABV9TCS2_9GAMM|nr:hypothetical protein [Pseudofrancisella aestuarii]
MFSDKSKVAIFGDIGEDLRQELKCEIKDFPEAREDQIHLSLAYNAVDAVIINIKDQTAFLNTIYDIRSSSKTYLIPIFCINPEDTKYVDEQYSNFETLVEYINVIKQESSSLSNKKHIVDRAKRDWQFRLITYLFTRKVYNKTLDAYFNEESDSLFSYPLIEVFSNKKNCYLEWLSELETSEFIKIKSQVKSCLCCIKCSSAHLIFSECCPHCNNESLSTEHSCNKCGKHFEKVNIISTCLECKTVSDIHNLGKLKIYNYEIADKAEQYIRIDIDHALSAFDNINYISPDFFYSMLEWNSNMQYRNKEYIFSLIKISVIKKLDIEQIDNFIKGVKSLLRKTDVLTRISEKNIWIWLPNTFKDDGLIVLNRLKSTTISENTTIEDITNIKLFFSEDLGKIENAENTILKLTNQ